MSKVASFLVCILAVIPVAVLCKPNPNSDVVAQPHPQVQPPVGGSVGPVPYGATQVKGTVVSTGPVKLDSESNQTGGTVNGSPAIHLEEVVTIHPDAGSQQSKIKVPVPSCPKILNPVCGSDNNTYNSPCELSLAQRSDPTLQQAKVGAC